MPNVNTSTWEFIDEDYINTSYYKTLIYWVSIDPEGSWFFKELWYDKLMGIKIYTQCSVW